MKELLTINKVIFPDMEGEYSITYTDKTNIYESESGEKTVEIIRQKICSISVSYNGLTEKRCRELADAIRIVNEVNLYDPSTGTVVIKTMKADTNRIKMGKKYYKNGLSVWSLSFGLEEM